MPWPRSVRPGLHLHDLWHTGNTLAAECRAIAQALDAQFSAVRTGEDRDTDEREDGSSEAGE